jgi:negative regulator of sigma E activity
MNEQFSAFLDGEATRDEADSVISALLRDDQLRESWGRQHWLRTTLRAHNGETAVPLDCSFADRVMEAIADDKPEGVVNTRRVVPMRVAARRRWRSMAGLAAVASAAGIVMLVSNPLQRDSASGTPGQTVASTAASSAAGAATGSSAATAADAMVASNDLSSDMLRQAGPSEAAVQRGPADHWSVSDPALEDELNGYLVEHNGLARGYGMSGTTPGFVRVATYGQDTPQ